MAKSRKKRGRTGSRLDMPVQRGEPVRAALVHLTIPLVGFSNLLKKFKIQNIAIFTAFPKKNYRLVSPLTVLLLIITYNWPLAHRNLLRIAHPPAHPQQHTAWKMVYMKYLTISYKIMTNTIGDNNFMHNKIRYIIFN